MVRRSVLNACGINLGGGLSIYQVFKKIPYFKVFSDYRIGKNKINNIIINYGIRVIYEFYCKFKFGKKFSKNPNFFLGFSKRNLENLQIQFKLFNNQKNNLNVF
jgi:hypothetical protein